MFFSLETSAPRLCRRLCYWHLSTLCQTQLRHAAPVSPLKRTLLLSLQGMSCTRDEQLDIWKHAVPRLLQPATNSVHETCIQNGKLIFHYNHVLYTMLQIWWNWLKLTTAFGWQAPKLTVCSLTLKQVGTVCLILSVNVQLPPCIERCSLVTEVSQGLDGQPNGTPNGLLSRPSHISPTKSPWFHSKPGHVRVSWHIQENMQNISKHALLTSSDACAVKKRGGSCDKHPNGHSYLQDFFRLIQSDRCQHRLNNLFGCRFQAKNGQSHVSSQ